MAYNFKIHSILLTKNEGDVIALCLRDALKWSDVIYVYDGQSTDATWDIVKSMAGEDPRIIAWKQDGKVFSEGLRAEVFNEFRHRSQEGDWWLQLNADEFYDVAPHDFLANIPRLHNFVWGINVEFYITDHDLQEIDFSLPFEEVQPLLRHYDITWSEPRCFRYRKRLEWSLNSAWPRHVGLVAKQRIYFRHYPYRSPQQIQMRLDVRRDNRSRGFQGWDHASQVSWKDKIVSTSKCHVEEVRGNFVIDELRFPFHLEPRTKRLVKLILHGVGLWP